MFARSRITRKIAKGSRLWLAPSVSTFMVNADNASADAPASGPLRTIAPEAPPSQLVHPATVFVHVNWDAWITVPSAGIYEDQPVAGLYEETWVTRAQRDATQLAASMPSAHGP